MRNYKIKVFCARCNFLLYEYDKAGPGRLVKCYRDKIIKDYTKGDLHCPSCGQQFARKAMIRGKPAYKIIQGKVFVKR